MLSNVTSDVRIAMLGFSIVKRKIIFTRVHVISLRGHLVSRITFWLTGGRRVMIMVMMIRVKMMMVRMMITFMFDKAP